VCDGEFSFVGPQSANGKSNCELTDDNPKPFGKSNPHPTHSHLER